MNEVFILGKIITEMDFKFIIKNKKKFSKVSFEIRTLEKQEITIIGYNDIADYSLKNLKKNDSIFINGKINTNMEIEIKEFKKM